MSNNDGAAVAISMSVGEELSRLMVQADHLREENERLREALRGIIEADCEAIKMNDGVVCLKPGPYAVIARTALGEKE